MSQIHQITLGDEIPRFNQDCLNSWHALPGFDVVTWTDAAAFDYLEKADVAEVKALYRKARNRGEASDILRMALTYTHGGLYVDWDVLLLDPRKFLSVMPDFEHCTCVLLRDQDTKDVDFPCTYDNSLFYMRQGNPLALDFIRAMARNYTRIPLPNTPYLTGPNALTTFLDLRPDYKNDCTMVDIVDVYAFDYNAVIEKTADHTKREVLRTYASARGAPAIHFWTHSWALKRTWSKRLIDRLAREIKTRTGLR